MTTDPAAMTGAQLADAIADAKQSAYYHRDEAATARSRGRDDIATDHDAQYAEHDTRARALLAEQQSRATAPAQTREGQAMTQTVIVDIDGTLALREGDSPRDWFEYDRVEEDVPNAPVIAVVEALAAAGHAIVFLSGRENVDFETHEDYAGRGLTGTCHDATMRWLRRHVDLPEIELYLRAEHDHRKDSVIKRELYEQHLAHRDVLCAIDDRDQVVAMWREDLGLTCLQVAYGDF